ncbi:hypothetical protein C8Q80DRAFT_1131299 [Daedaleopsis nitida]|nr:hypothetical protein C8Q80DRAFT_1131299 [Daedaleopsis nitida]
MEQCTAATARPAMCTPTDSYKASPASRQGASAKQSTAPLLFQCRNPPSSSLFRIYRQLGPPGPSRRSGTEYPVLAMTSRPVNQTSWPPTNPVAAHRQARPRRLARLLLRIVFRSESPKVSLVAQSESDLSSTALALSQSTGHVRPISLLILTLRAVPSCRMTMRTMKTIGLPPEEARPGPQSRRRQGRMARSLSNVNVSIQRMMYIYRGCWL